MKRADNIFVVIPRTAPPLSLDKLRGKFIIAHYNGRPFLVVKMMIL